MLVYCICFTFRVYAIHKLAKTLGTQNCKALLFFHALTALAPLVFSKAYRRRSCGKQGMLCQK